MLGIMPRFLRLVVGFRVVDDGIIGAESSGRKQALREGEACFHYLKFDESVAVLVLEVVKCLLRVNSTVFSEYYGWEDLVFFRPVEVADVGH